MSFISNFIKNKNNVSPTEYWDGVSTVQDRFEGNFTFSSTNQLLTIQRVSNTEYGGTLTIAGKTMGRVLAYPTPTGLKGKFLSKLMSPRFEIMENGGKYYIMQGVLTFDLHPITDSQAAIVEENAKQTIGKVTSFAKTAVAVAVVALVAEELIEGFSGKAASDTSNGVVDTLDTDYTVIEQDSSVVAQTDVTTHETVTEASLARQRAQLATMQANSREAGLLSLGSF